MSAEPKGISDERIVELRVRADEGGSITLHEGTELVAIIDRLRAAEAERDKLKGVLQSANNTAIRRGADRDSLREQLAVMERALEIYEEYSRQHDGFWHKDLIEEARQQIAAEKGKTNGAI